MIDIASAFTGLSTTLDVVKAAVAARDQAMIEKAVQEMSAKLTQALMSGLQASQEAHALETALRKAEREKADLEEKLRDRAMYQLEDLGAGGFAYGSQPQAEGPEVPKHYCCQPCYDSGVKSILRQTTGAYRVLEWTCPTNAKHTFKRDWERFPD